MKKKFLLYILIFLIITVCVFACYKLNKSTDNRKTVVFWTLQLSTFDKYINNIISEFESQNPDIKIKWIDVPYSEGEKRTLASVLTDNPPDLVNATPDFSLLLAQKNALYPIKKELLADFTPALTELLSYNDYYFGIPFYATSAVTLYNKNIVGNLTYSKLPKAYDELFDFKLKNAENSYLTMISFSENDTLLKLLNKYGINSPETINNEQSVKLFEKFKSLYAAGVLPKESVTQTHRDSLEKFMSGQIAFLVTGANFINMIQENAPLVYKNLGVAPQLTGSGGQYDFSLMNFIVPKKAKHAEEAVKFALFFTNKQNQLDFAKLTPVLPVNSEALNDDYFSLGNIKFESSDAYIKHILNSNYDVQKKARMISAYQLNYPQQPLKNIKNKKELNTLSSNYVQSILINNAPIKESLNKFSSDWQKL